MSQMSLNTLVRWTDTEQGEDPKHLALHLAKLAGSFSSYAEMVDHGEQPSAEFMEKLLKARIPDLVIVAAMLARHFDLNLNDLVIDRGDEVTGHGRW